MYKSIRWLAFIALAFLAFHCKKSDVTVVEGIDPFSPKPGEPDSWEKDDSSDAGTYLNWISGNNFGTGGTLAGTMQKHSFHAKTDTDWYRMETKNDQRAIVEIFNVSSGISTILQLFYMDSGNNLVKIWGSDSGLVDTNFAAQKLAEIPSTLSGASLPQDITGLNQRIWLRRDSTGGVVTYFLKVTIPPFLFREGKDANYFIRARGSGEYNLNVPSSVTATRDQHTDRIILNWTPTPGATTYRVIRDSAPVTLTCSTWPCTSGSGFTLSGNKKLVLSKTQTTPSYQYKQTSTSTMTDFTDDTDIADSSVSQQLIHDKGNWVENASGSLYCFTNGGSSVQSVTIKAGKNGSGYGATPGVSFTGGSGSGASATATLSGGTITAVNVTAAGSGYLTPPSVTFVGGNPTTAAEAYATLLPSGGTIRRYNWSAATNNYRIDATSANDAIDEKNIIPVTPVNNPQKYVFTSIGCEYLPGDTTATDDPKVGEMYNYAVYACDDILQSCTGPSGTTEQANQSFGSGGGGSLKISLDTPVLVSVSDNNDGGIWVAFKDVNSNKVVTGGTQNPYVRYSIQRSESINGPFTEVECQMNASSSSAANSGMLREFDDRSANHKVQNSGGASTCTLTDGSTVNCSNATMDYGKSYYYRVIAQQLRDGITCTGPNCGSLTNRKGRDTVLAVDETDTSGSPANDSADNNCTADVDYFNSQLVSESAASNVMTGNRRRLGNYAMAIYNRSSSYTSTVLVTSNINTKTLLLTNTNDSVTPPTVSTLKIDLRSNTYTYDHPTAGVNSGTWTTATAVQINALCTFINGAINGQDEWGCATTDANYGPTGAFATAPAALLRGTNSSQVIPNGTGNMGISRYALDLENRVFASKGYHTDKIRLRWAPVQGADRYNIYRITSTTNTPVPLINVIYHGTAVTATLKVDNGILFTSLANQASGDQSQNLTVNLSASDTDTIGELVSYLNQQKGYSAWVTDPSIKVISASTVQNTVSISNNTLDLRTFDSRGLPNPVTLNVSAPLGLFPANLTTAASSFVNSVNSAYNTASTYTYDDSGATANQDSYYLIQAVNVGSGNSSPDFITDYGFQRSSTIGGGGVTADTFDAVMKGTLQSGAEGDEYDFSDEYVANVLEYGIANTWVSTQNYQQYVQRDNDRFVPESVTPAVKAVPTLTGNNVRMKIGVHEDPATASQYGYQSTHRTNSFLPCSFHNPGNTACTGGNVRWPGDPDILYDDNSGTGGNEPFNVITMTIDNPRDIDFLWFFGQKRFYEFSQGSEYQFQYNNRSGNPLSGDAGCWPNFNNTVQYYGPFDPQASGGTPAAGFARPCSLNQPTGLGGDTTPTDGVPDYVGPSANRVPGAPERAYARKNYQITFTNATAGYTGPLVVDFYSVWPKLSTYNASYSGTENFIVTPDASKAPFYSRRLNSGDSFIFKIPSSGFYQTYRGIGLVEYPACTSMTTVTFTGGAGTGAKAYADVQGGAVNSVNISATGTGYTSAPAVAINRGAGVTAGTNAVGAARLKIIGVTLVSGGNNYSPNDIITISGGTAGVVAKLKVTGAPNNVITSVAIDTAGEYTAAPSNPVSVTGAGSGATFNLVWGVGKVIVTTAGTNYNYGHLANNSSGLPPCMISPVCTKTSVSSHYTQTSDGSNLCAKMPIRGLSLCNVDANNDGIFEKMNTDTDGVGNQTACLPAPYYTAADNFLYHGKTCDGSAFTVGQAQCPPPGMHVIMKMYSPQGSTGQFQFQVKEVTVSGDDDTDFGTNQ